MPQIDSATRRTRRHAGFTIIELVVVIAIIGVLMGAAGLALPRILSGAKVDTTKNDLQTLANGLQIYNTRTGQYPPPGTLQPLLSEGIVSKPSDIEDAWNNPIEFYTNVDYNGQTVAWMLVSLGENGQYDGPGAGDDIILADGFDIEAP